MNLQLKDVQNGGFGSYVLHTNVASKLNRFKHDVVDSSVGKLCKTQCASWLLHAAYFGVGGVLRHEACVRETGIGEARSSKPDHGSRDAALRQSLPSDSLT
jgi:hypothetical protein